MVRFAQQFATVSVVNRQHERTTSRKLLRFDAERNGIDRVGGDKDCLGNQRSSRIPFAVKSELQALGSGKLFSDVNRHSDLALPVSNEPAPETRLTEDFRIFETTIDERGRAVIDCRRPKIEGVVKSLRCKEQTDDFILVFCA